MARTRIKIGSGYENDWRAPLLNPVIELRQLRRTTRRFETTTGRFAIICSYALTFLAGWIACDIATWIAG